jgi:hypothetical protein
MDCIFNSYIPKPRSNEIIYKPSSKTFINGLASSYDFYYDHSLIGPFMKEAHFNYLTNCLNEELYRNWPCTICFLCGYICSPCTLGLSFFCPYSCIKLAKENFINKLEHYNSQHFLPKGLSLSYQQKCSTSWVLLTIKSNNSLDSLKSSLYTNKATKNREKEYEFNSQTELFLKSVDSQIKIDLRK